MPPWSFPRTDRCQPKHGSRLPGSQPPSGEAGTEASSGGAAPLRHPAHGPAPGYL